MKLHIDMYINHKCRNRSIINKNGLTAGRGSRGELQQVCLEAQEGLSIHSKTCGKRDSCPSGISQLGETNPPNMTAVTKYLKAVWQKEDGADQVWSKGLMTIQPPEKNKIKKGFRRISVSLLSLLPALSRNTAPGVSNLQPSHGGPLLPNREHTRNWKVGTECPCFTDKLGWACDLLFCNLAPGCPVSQELGETCR